MHHIAAPAATTKATEELALEHLVLQSAHSLMDCRRGNLHVRQLLSTCSILLPRIF
jgi:hypothetical protein